jgi:hypothetical protein
VISTTRIVRITANSFFYMSPIGASLHLRRLLLKAVKFHVGVINGGKRATGAALQIESSLQSEQSKL